MLHAPATAPEVRRALAQRRGRRGPALGGARAGADGGAAAAARGGAAARPGPRLAAATPRWRSASAATRAAATRCGVVGRRGAAQPASRARTASRPGCPWTWPRRASSWRRSLEARCRSAVPALLRALEDVRARPYVADALGALGDDRARGALAGRPGKRAVRDDAAPRGARAARPRGARLVGRGARAPARCTPRSRCPRVRRASWCSCRTPTPTWPSRPTATAAAATPRRGPGTRGRGARGRARPRQAEPAGAPRPARLERRRRGPVGHPGARPAAVSIDRARSRP